MNRRRFLETAGSTSLAAVAGCLGGEESGSESGTSTDTTTVPEGEGAPKTSTPTRTQTEVTRSTPTPTATPTPAPDGFYDFAQIKDTLYLDDLLGRDEVDAEVFEGNYDVGEGRTRMFDIINNYEVVRLDEDRKATGPVRSLEFSGNKGDVTFGDEESGIAVAVNPGAFRSTFGVSQAAEYMTTTEVEVDDQTYHLSNILSVDEQGEASYTLEGYVQELDDELN